MREEPQRGGGVALVILILAIIVAGASVGFDIGAPHRVGGLLSRPGAPALFGAGCALAAAGVGHLMRLVLGRGERSARHAADRA